MCARLDRIEGTRGEGEVQELARRLAEVTGIVEVELIAEAARIARACHAQGITTVAGMVRCVAADLGIPVAQLEQEMARIRALTA
jgi:hypothetical protein